MEDEVKARQYLLRVLGRRSYLSAECRIKLQRKGFSLMVIDRVIAHCQERGYLNDAQYLERLTAQEKRQGRSFLALKQKWMQKSGGDGALLAQTGVRKEEFEQEALTNYLAKKGGREALSDPQEKQKLIQRLLQRGFSWDTIQQVLKHDN